MLPTTELQYSVPFTVAPSLRYHPEISRLLAAAVVSSSFRQLLLVDPQQAIENGYQGETFLLSDTERYMLLYIHADTLADLARQIAQSFGMGLPLTAPVYGRMPELIGYEQ
jgi:hypothetical protein